MNIRLYQSTSKPSEVILALLLERTLERDKKKALVRCGSKEQALTLSEKLWQAESFLPHGVAEEDSHELQPIWLSYENQEDKDIKADILFLCDSLVPDIGDSKKEDCRFADIILLFDKSDIKAVEVMREFWKYLQEADLPHVEEVIFWQEEKGKWKEAARQKNGQNKQGDKNAS